MSEAAKPYAGRILKRSVRADALGDGTAASANPAYPDIPTEELRDVILAEAQRDADKLRKARMAELEGEIERAVAHHVVNATRELNLSLAAASGDIARIVDAAVRRITGEKPEGKLIANIVRQAVRERNAERGATVTVSSQDYPKLELSRMAAGKRDELQWITVVEDETMAPGRVILTINKKNYDISLENQLEALNSALQLDGETLAQAASA